MSNFSDSADILNDKEVRNFFLSILDSRMTSEEKYEKFVQFFHKRNEIKSGILTQVDQLSTANEEEVKRIALRIGKELGTWDPERILSQTEDSIRRAVRRLRASQHRDGGWGPRIESSESWGTAYSLLCLIAARTLSDIEFGINIDEIILQGVNWLEDHNYDWRVDSLGEYGERPVYYIWIVALALHGVNKEYRRETQNAREYAINRLAESQNEDGGWDACLWGISPRERVRVWSEVGSTSSAIRTLAMMNRPEFHGHILKGLEWLVQTQNENGSWNLGNCRPELPRYQLTGIPVINKTCDALKGLLVALKLELPYDDYKRNIDLAVEWLRRQEKLLLDEEGNIRGWGWVNDRDGQPATGYSTFDYENTAMTLETLVEVPDAPLPLLTANAEWLIQTQHRQDGNVEDGNWKMGDTARIALALIEYYKKIKSAYTA